MVELFVWTLIALHKIRLGITELHPESVLSSWTKSFCNLLAVNQPFAFLDMHKAVTACSVACDSMAISKIEKWHVAVWERCIGCIESACELSYVLFLAWPDPIFLFSCLFSSTLRLREN